MINLLNFLRPEKVPKPKFNSGELVIHNQGAELRDWNDQLYLIRSRRFGICTDYPLKKWYYDGIKLEIKKTTSKGVPYAPFFSTGCSNTPEEYLHKLEEIKINF